MHKYLLLFLFSFICLTANAQSFEITPNPALGEANTDMPSTDPDDVVATAHISNNTSDSLFLRWERIDNTRPNECWETAVCDVNLCYFPTVSTKDFVLPPNFEDGEMLVHAYTGGSPGDDPTTGETTIILKISNLNDPADTLIVNYNFEVTGTAECMTSSVSVAEREALKIFPNPASDYFQLTETHAIEQLVVYNILGRKVATFAVNSGENYDISGFPNGVYLVGMVDQDEKIVKTIRLQKH